MIKRKIFFAPIFLLCLLSPFTTVFAITSADYFVKTPGYGGNDLNDGTSWAAAKATITSAIASVSGTNTIHVAAGTYTENITFVSNLTLLGGYPADAQDGDPRDPATNETIIDGNTSGSVVTFIWVANCTIDGFTIRNGSGTELNTDQRAGGGIYCYASASITISHNLITANNVRTPNWGQGGGIYCLNSSPHIFENTLQNNTALFGGGIYCKNVYEGTPADISENTIRQNNAVYGGGILIEGIPSSQAVTIDHNQIRENMVIGSGGGIQVSSGNCAITNNLITSNGSNEPASSGGGIHFECDDYSPGSALIQKNQILENKTTQHGGGIEIIGYGTVTIDSNIITGNTSAFGAGIRVNSTHVTATIVNNLINNNAGTNGGGIRVNDSAPGIINNTIVNNPSGSGIAVGVVSLAPVVVNNIIWGNGDDLGGDITPDMIRYCNIEDGDFNGTNGNISSAPLFADPDGSDNIAGTADDNFHLQPGSPCIDAGTGDYGAPATDYDGNPRFDDPATTNTGGGTPNFYDIGYDEYLPCSDGETRSCPNQDGVCSGKVEVCTGYQWPGCDYTSIKDYEKPEATCNDTFDNDCDGFEDCADPDCTLGADCCGTLVIEAEEMDYHANGTADGDYWLLWANGAMREEVSFPDTGAYRFEVIAKGDLAYDVGPQMGLLIDGVLVDDAVFVDTITPETFVFDAEISEGAHTVAIRFYNDVWIPAEIDRNLYVDRITIALASCNEGICNDGLDNDGDGDTDCADPDCTLGTDCCGTVVIEAEEMDYHANGVADGDYWLLWANGMMREEGIYFPDASVYRFEVIAKGDLAYDIGPQMGLLIDGVLVDDAVFVDTTTSETFVFDANISEGVHTVAIRFYNDLWFPPDIDRNLYVDQITITPRYCSTIEYICNDGLDNDSDGFVDCEDSDCTLGADCCGTVVVEAEEMDYHANGAEVGDYWNLWANGAMREEVYFPDTGAYRFAVIAKGDLAYDIGPQMGLLIDGVLVGDAVFVDTTTPESFVFDAEISEGVHTVAIRFYNDVWIPPAIDRNLYVDKITLALLSCGSI